MIRDKPVPIMKIYILRRLIMRNFVKFGAVGLICCLIGFYRTKYKTLKNRISNRFENDTKVVEDEAQ